MLDEQAARTELISNKFDVCTNRLLLRSYVVLPNVTLHTGRSYGALFNKFGVCTKQDDAITKPVREPYQTQFIS